MDKTSDELLKRIEILENRLKEVEEKPYRCEVCGRPTDGWVRTLFWTNYYCREHYPMAY